MFVNALYLMNYGTTYYLQGTTYHIPSRYNYTLNQLEPTLRNRPALDINFIS